MAGAVHTFPEHAAARINPDRANTEPMAVRWILTAVVIAFLSLFLLLPLFIVFQEAFAKGLTAFIDTFCDSATWHAIRLTLTVAAIVVPLNTLFGLMAAYSLTRFEFWGRGLIISLIDLPLWVSPVIGGEIYVLLYGAQGWFGSWLRAHDIKIIFALPGIVLATLFVTFPFVARGLIPLMQAQGAKEEEAALTLGANGWQIFRRITLPKIKWGLLYGVILCNARAMGEFGAVSVVSGHIRNRTNTMPLHIEILYNEYQSSAAFAVATLLAILALITLILKTYAEWKAERQLLDGSDISTPSKP